MNFKQWFNEALESPASNLPDWSGASAVYSKAYDLLAQMGQGGHVKRTYGHRGGKGLGINKRGYGHSVSASPDMEELIDALDVGDEEKIKGLLLLHNSLGRPRNEF